MGAVFLDFSLTDNYLLTLSPPEARRATAQKKKPCIRNKRKSRACGRCNSKGKRQCVHIMLPQQIRTVMHCYPSALSGA